MSKQGSRTLESLREELGEIDGRLLELIKRREELGLEIGAAKRAAGRSPRDYRQERDVIERARRRATVIGLSPDLAEELVVTLIRSSLTVQEKDRVATGGGGCGKRVLVIGGAGQMGQWFGRFLGSQGYEIEIADPGGAVEGVQCWKDWRDSPLEHDLIVVAAPLSASAEVLAGLADRRPPGVVFDIGSLKSPLREGLAALRGAGVRATSIHPMFGPDTELLSGRHVIFIDLGDAEATEVVRDLFRPTMALPIDMDLESHDRVIAYVLGLSHAINIAFFTALAESGEAAPALAQLSSTTFDAQLAVASRVAAENPGLYFEIQNLNDYGTESLSALLYAVERVRSVVRAGDEPGFAALMRRGLEYLAGRRRGEDPPP
jgi:chorismate mutase/prephenate dehydrogenase